jgi:hypothetical protein
VDKTSLILLGAAGAALAGTSAVLLFRKGPDAAEKERLRLKALHEHGRLALGHVVDVRDSAVFFSYEVSGVGYTAAQDLGQFGGLDVTELLSLAGPLNIKYDRANPSNSMVYCDQWSGLGLPAKTTTV